MFTKMLQGVAELADLPLREGLTKGAGRPAVVILEGLTQRVWFNGALRNIAGGRGCW